MTSTTGGPSIAVAGTGAVGGYFGGLLAAAGHDVRFLARGDTLTALRHKGLRVTGASGELTVPQVRATDDPREIGPVDYVLLCVKTWQLPAALAALEPVLGAGTAVVTVQNGVDAPGEAAAVVGRDRVLPGLVRVVATTEGPGEVRQFGPPGALALAEWDGAPSDRVERLRGVLREAGVPAPETADVWAGLWAKFLLIVPVGTLGAATGGASIGELRERPATRRLLLEGMREVHATATALGVTLPPDALETAAAMMDRQQADATTSLQRDLLAGRPSELEAWTGSAVRHAASAGVPVPLLGTLYEVLAARAARTAERA